MSQLPNKFNIRVYGLFFNDRNEILLSDEFHFGMIMTKFPGGGLQFGEGTIDCLVREMKEEGMQEIEVTEHFYTTDFYQKAFFTENQQLISIYYKAKLKGPVRIKIADRLADFTGQDEGDQSFRWVPLERLTPEEITLPVDRHVTRLLKKSEK